MSPVNVKDAIGYARDYISAAAEVAWLLILVPDRDSISKRDVGRAIQALLEQALDKFGAGAAAMDQMFPVVMPAFVEEAKARKATANKIARKRKAAR